MGKAFLFGGVIAVIGQALIDMYSVWFHMNEPEAVRWMNGTLIVCAAIWTPTRLYRQFTQFAGAGMIVPMMSLANIWSASALEYRNEGAAEHMLSVGGSIIVTLVAASYVASLFL
ncbi:stage V sporulation protein AC [Anoxybacillus gonensis]|uniref:SpoVA/SpoVAEb family sporulation membrane protein n=1 Tax=Anoxybacillus gonensis TaxID=198467 RepID=A0AAW7TDT8_9BACL|nr:MULTISPECIES: SpoVA/SpoVAEb family sporulation membrane protein [Anoxybacillus]AXM89981.1 SpoVA/SpoVAEb family sporulation membrane protein [Anoxybacillus ayderensis G10]THD17341.1 SpoVA/SpoVAEb family sporulation membrane protein [Anoxybacillus ayderensis]AKS38771.1 stage V sporulation protein AC [Anoxybacillus gonensis]EMI09756.1 stage V sporulation protein AC [Anoxybacillus gonensis]KGP60120.1 stage V sporulation protein AC [Anoxybacillus gonensis]